MGIRAVKEYQMPTFRTNPPISHCAPNYQRKCHGRCTAGPPVGVSARGVIKNPISHYFGCQIRILRGRFTPSGFLLKEVFQNFIFLYFGIFSNIFHGFKHKSIIFQ